MTRVRLQTLEEDGATGEVWIRDTASAAGGAYGAAGGAPSGPAGGDLTGTYPDPTVATGVLALDVIEDQSSGILVGRDSPGNGPLETITLNATLELTGTGFLRRAAISGDVVIATGDSVATLASSGVVAGSYTNADITVDAKGRVTVAANGAGGSGLSQAQVLARGMGA